ncbi:MAG: ParA family protein [Gammaproteobacteria bacterium]|nr:ParA family protein [Gammaproteobacteria bacterium]
MAKRVSVINFKGGVGKTTLAFNFAAGLARYHEANVLLIDMDHQSSLSIVCLGTECWNEISENCKSIVSVFQNFYNSNMPEREIVYSANFGNHSSYSKRIKIVPASLALDDVEIELTSSYHGDGNTTEWKKRTLICRWLQDTRIDGEYDYIIFDCAPATKIVTQNAIAASHGFIVPVVPEAVMERGTPHLKAMISSGIDQKIEKLSQSNQGDHFSTYVPKTEFLGVVITRMQVAGNSHSGYTNDHTQHAKNLERRWNEDLIKPYILQGVGISEALAERVPVYDRDYSQNVGSRGIHKQFKELTEKLKNRIDDL